MSDQKDHCVGEMHLEREAKQTNWRDSFHQLESKVFSQDRFTQLSTDIATKRCNRELNRYENVLAYDHSRVRICHNSQDLYINANHVEVNEVERKYILTQGPLMKTVDDFWLMVWQQHSPSLVMLCNCFENNMSKSWQYWPLEVGHTMLLGDDREGLELEVSLVSVEDRGHFVIRSFVLTDGSTGEKRKVRQYHYLNWPDFDVPRSPQQFLEFVAAVRESGCFSEGSGPPVVHCSAGIGRSGTLILVDSCLKMAEDGKSLTLNIILETLLEMRTQRWGLIQTEQQLRFSVDAIVHGLKNVDLMSGKASDTGKQTHHTNGKRLKEDSEESGDSTDNDKEEDGQSKSKKRKNSES